MTIKCHTDEMHISRRELQSRAGEERGGESEHYVENRLKLPKKLCPTTSTTLYEIENENLHFTSPRGREGGMWRGRRDGESRGNSYVKATRDTHLSDRCS